MDFKTKKQGAHIGGPAAGQYAKREVQTAVLANRMRIASSPNFQQWFEGAVTVDAQGLPLALYHGTDQSFDSFSHEFCGEATGRGDFGDAFYFTDDPLDAGHFAGEREGANLVPVFLNIRNPIRNDILSTARVQEILDDDMGFEDLGEYLAERGYDGIIFQHSHGKLEYVVFDPRKIKSAIGNNGEFDPDEERFTN